MNEILDYTKKFNLSFVDYILKYEGESIIPYLYSILEQMKKTINNGIYTDGILPGGLNVIRKASLFYQKYLENHVLNI